MVENICIIQKQKSKTDEKYCLNIYVSHLTWDGTSYGYQHVNNKTPFYDATIHKPFLKKAKEQIGDKHCHFFLQQDFEERYADLVGSYERNCTNQSVNEFPFLVDIRAYRIGEKSYLKKRCYYQEPYYIHVLFSINRRNKNWQAISILDFNEIHKQLELLAAENIKRCQ